MTLALEAPVGSTRVVAVGDTDEMTRGRAAEFRHRGLSLAARPTAVGALLELGKDPSSVVLVPTTISDMPILQFVELVTSLAHAPVIIGLAPGSENELVAEAFEHGASGVVALPVTAQRLMQAISATAKTTPPQNEPVHTCGDLIVDIPQHRVTWEGREVNLALKEFEVLAYLVAAFPRVVRFDELLRDFEAGNPDHVYRLRASISRLRGKLHAAVPWRPEPLHTLHGVGYRLEL